MTYNSPKGEHAGKPGTTWEQPQGEQLVEDEEWDTQDPREAVMANREDRRRLGRALKASQGLKRARSRRKG